jgi:hypothetical protein
MRCDKCGTHKFVSVSSIRVHLAATNYGIYAGEFRGWHTKITSVSSRNIQAGSQKVVSVCRRRIEGGTQKTPSVSPRSVQGGRQEIASECTRSVDSGTQKTASVSSIIIQVGNLKFLQSAGDVSRVAKQYVTVLEECPSWQPIKGVV